MKLPCRLSLAKMMTAGVVIGTTISALSFRNALTNEPGAKINQPNIVVILADDMGYGDIRAYNPESQIPTPNLDKLAVGGLRFTDAHSGSSVCTPTRYGLITGRYSFRSSLKKGVLGGYSPPLIENDRFTIADLLNNAGYHTGIVGKWHLGLSFAIDSVITSTNSPADSTFDWPNGNGINVEKPLLNSPNELGFDYSYIISASLDMPPYVYFDDKKPTEQGIIKLEGSKYPRGVFWREGKASPNFNIHGTLDHFSKKATEFISKSARSEKPFFLYLPLTGPHTPWLPSQRFKGKSKAGIYGDFVAHTDAVVGEVMHTLDSLGITDNTLIIFTSDNGADWKPGDKKLFPAHQANYIFRGQKSDIWEGGHRVPFLASWPGNIKPGRQTSNTICLTDLLATFATITHQKIPASAAQDSFDFSTVLTNNAPVNPTRQSIIHHSINGMFALRKGKWKYIEGKGSGGWSEDNSPTADLQAQLYDLETDPTESKNVIKSFPDIARNLDSELQKQKKSGYTRLGSNK
ncbi:arylsulfatase [Spirosoma aureum]|uniref:Arylsulfatase n=1 Tax=Spirosoma aureum TaxID=2692134 RepID=A0A6G9AKH6_9BACT|nr:arylsulfatase [Spirosoma aureum]QIP12971.1 arylsulfatase [Spirosoma aureum]